MIWQHIKAFFAELFRPMTDEERDSIIEFWDEFLYGD